MGAGASACVAAATKAATAEELQGALTKLSVKDRQKLLAALSSAQPPKLDREAVLKKIFTVCDDDLSGSLSIMEYKQLSADTGSRSLGMMAIVFDMVDAGGVPDGKLSVDEFVKYNMETGASLSDSDFNQQADAWLTLAKERVALGEAGRETMLTKVFETCDLDKNGSLSIPEYKSLAAGADSRTQSMMAALFEIIDSGGIADGKVSLDEFTKFNLDSGKSMSDADFKVQVDSWLTLTKKRNTVMKS